MAFGLVSVSQACGTNADLPQEACHHKRSRHEYCQDPLQIAQLLLNGLADLGNPRSHFLSHGQMLLPGFLAMCSRLIAKGCFDLRMHRINQLLRDFSGFIEKREVRLVSDIGGDARSVDQQGALTGGCIVRAILRGLIAAGHTTAVILILIILIGLRFCGSNDNQDMMDIPFVAFVDG